MSWEPTVFNKYQKKAMVCNPSCILESPTELEKNTDAQNPFKYSSRIWVRFEHKNFYKAPQVNSNIHQDREPWAQRMDISMLLEATKQSEDDH